MSLQRRKAKKERDKFLTGKASDKLAAKNLPRSPMATRGGGLRTLTYSKKRESLIAKWEFILLCEEG